jgi:hypothetical protein
MEPMPPRLEKDFTICRIASDLDIAERHAAAGFEPMAGSVVYRRFFQFLDFIRRHVFTVRTVAGIWLAVGLLTATGCRRPSPHDIVADAITEEYSERYVHPLCDPVARLARKGDEIPPGLLHSNRVTLVEVILKGGERRTIFQDEADRPPGDGGMVTVVDHARGIGLFYPATLSQREIEVRVNYSNDFGDAFVAVHLAVPNPLLIEKVPTR